MRKGAAVEEAEPVFLALRAAGVRVVLARSTREPPPAEPASPPPTASAATPSPAPLSPPAAAPPASSPPGWADLPTLSNPPPPTDGASVATAAEDDAEDETSFWRSVPASFLVPLRGGGLKWLIACTAYGAFYGVVLFGVMVLSSAGRGHGLHIYGALLALFFGAMLLGLVYGYFRACLWGVLSKDHEAEPMRELEPSVITGWFRDGLMLMLFQCLLQGVFVLWLVSSMRQGLTLAVLPQSPVAWVLLFVFSLYWPLGLGLMAVNSSRGAFWSFGQGFPIMIHALPEFFVTTVLVSLVYLVPSILFMSRSSPRQVSLCSPRRSSSAFRSRTHTASRAPC